MGGFATTRRWHSALAAVLAGSVLAAAPLPAVQPNLRFARLTPADGLSQVTVQAILQDRTGFVWIGTQDGLNRVDGSGVTVFRNDPEDSTSLSDSNIAELYEAKDGKLWVVTQLEGGINRYDPVTGRFRRFVRPPGDEVSPTLERFVPGAICELADGTMWFGTFGRGIVAISPGGRAERILHDPQDPDSLASDAILALYRDRAGGVWVGTRDAGLDRWVPPGPHGEPAHFVHFRHDPDDPGSLGDDTVTAILEDHTGTLWVGTRLGFNILDPAGNRFFHFPSKEVHGMWPEDMPVPVGRNFVAEDLQGGMWLPTPKGLARISPARDRVTVYEPDPAHPGAVPGLNIRAVAVDRSGDVWVGCRSGLYRWLPDTDRFQHFQHEPRDPRSLVEDRVVTLYVDRGGVLWIGTEAAGASRYSRFANQFGHYVPRVDDPSSLSDRTVYALLEDSAGTLWVGTAAGGLNRFDRSGRRVVEHYGNLPGSPRNIGGSWVRAVLEDSRGRFWTGAIGGGLSLIDRDRGRVVKRYTHDPEDSTTLSSNAVQDIFEDSHGRLWVGTARGWDLFDPDTGRFRRFEHDPEDPTSLVDMQARFTYEDRQGTLWIGTVGGLSRFNEATGKFTNFTRNVSNTNSLSHNNVMAMLETDDGAYWLATFGGGLDRWDPATGGFTHFTTSSGFPSDSLYAILQDDDGYLWVTSNNGLIRVDPHSGETRRYGEEDGLQANEFDGRSACKMASGELVFGGINGFNRFDPRTIERSEHVAPVVLTDIRTDGVTPLLPLAVPSVGEITLAYTVRHFTFEFATLDFDRPGKARFAYMLDGFDTDWLPAGATHDARYTKVPAGHYTFRVKAANADGVWSERGASLSVIVVPPPWRSPWAYGLYAALLVGGVLGYVRYKTNAHRVEMEIRRTTEELERARSIQLSMLPDAPPHVPGLDIAVHMETASEVGGDYYDFFPQTDGSLYIVTGDATGHGLAAGMMVGMTKAALRALDVAPPDRLLDRLDDVFRTVNVQRMRMAMNILWIRGDEVHFSSAGMPPMLVYRAATGAVSELLIPGLPLGGATTSEYRLRTLQLNPGDALVLLSDGLPEWIDASGEPLGYEPVRRLVASCGHLPPDALVHQLLSLGLAHGAGEPHHDDITLMVIRRKA